MLLAFGLLQVQDPFRVAPDTAVLPALGVLVLLGTALAGWRRGEPRLAAAGTAFLQLTLFTLLGVVLSYAVAARGGALWDPQLAAWDRLLGFDWVSIRDLADRSNALAWLLGLAYHSLILQMVVVVVALSSLARLDALRTLVCAAILSGFATILVSGLMPAAGNLFRPEAYRHLWPPVAFLQAELIAGLRSGSMRVLDLGAMQGIITFPSYHAALATLFIWAFRTVPKLAGPGAVWAGLTILATPLGGGHYAVDVIAGILLGLASIPAARVLVRLGLRRSPAPERETVEPVITPPHDGTVHLGLVDGSDRPPPASPAWAYPRPRSTGP